jgi:hypothetical protein
MTTLQFPELRLRQNDAHLMRGYFGNAFREHSLLLHNHLEDGANRLGYPEVQYKIVDGTPTIIGLNEGADTLVKLFADIKEINIDGTVLDAAAKELRHDRIDPVLLTEELASYEFVTSYQALNQEQYRTYRNIKTDRERFTYVSKVLTGHLLMVFKGLGVWLDGRIVVWPILRPGIGKMKGQRVTIFHGSFVTNVALPDLIGVGKATSRGFGTIRRVKGGLGALG